MSTYANQVKIGPSFFSGAFKDYSNWHWAWIREIIQNSVDAKGSNEISFLISENIFTNQTEVAVSNNGEIMTKEILVNKFLSLGESGKRFENSVGGFGKAKELLVFCHDEWVIRSGNLFCWGSGGDYNLEDNAACYIAGTTTNVKMKGNQADELIRQLKKYASMMSWHGTLMLNGERLDTTTLAADTFRKDLEFGSIYTVKNKHKNNLITRINGIPMFSRWVDFEEGCIILELKGSDNVLTANRDGLIWSYQSEMNDFVDLVNMNRSAAFKDTKKAEKKKFSGYKLSGKLVAADIRQDIKVTDHLDTAAASSVREILNVVRDNHEIKINEESNSYVESFFRPEFYLRNELDQKIPDKVIPGTFSKNSVWLINVWAAVLVEIATLAKNNEPFSIGFVFSDEAAAQYEYSYPDNILYVNPLTEDHKNRFSSKNVWDLVAAAVHEYCHLEGYTRHDEKYATRLTDLMGIVLANRSKISAAIKSANQWVDK